MWIGRKISRLRDIRDNWMLQVRGAAVFSLGTFISSIPSRDRSDHARLIDQTVAITLATTVTHDGSPLVRQVSSSYLEVHDCLDIYLLLIISPFFLPSGIGCGIAILCADIRELLLECCSPILFGGGWNWPFPSVTSLFIRQYHHVTFQQPYSEVFTAKQQAAVLTWPGQSV